jgi:hypothetical protein
VKNDKGNINYDLSVIFHFNLVFGRFFTMKCVLAVCCEMFATVLAV